MAVNPLAITTYDYFDNIFNLWRNRWPRACSMSMIMIESPPGKHEQHGSNKMNKMYYSDGLDVYVYIYEDRSAKVNVFCENVKMFVKQEGREVAAATLKSMRKQQMNITRDYLTSYVEN